LSIPAAQRGVRWGVAQPHVGGGGRERLPAGAHDPRLGPVEGAVPGVFNSGLQVLMGYTSDIAGIANTTLQGADTNSANVAYTPLQLDVLRSFYYKTSIRAGAWNIFSGVFTPSPVTEYLGGWNISAGVDNSQTLRASGTDVAANPSQSAPGRLTYQDGNPDPVNKSYPARYNW